MSIFIPWVICIGVTWFRTLCVTKKLNVSRYLIDTGKMSKDVFCSGCMK